MESHETILVDRSPLIAPNISSAIAPTAKIISGMAGAMSGNGNIGTGPGLLKAGAAHACRLGGSCHLLDQVVDRSLDRTQKRQRVDAHPQNENNKRYK